MEAVIPIIVSALVSGLLSTVITLIVTHYFSEMKYRVSVLDDVLGYRYQCNKIYKGTRADLAKALNRIPIAFAKCPEVLDAWDTLNFNMIEYGNKKFQDNYVTLIKKMCKACKIDYSLKNDDFLIRNFSTSV